MMTKKSFLLEVTMLVIRTVVTKQLKNQLNITKKRKPKVILP